LTYLLIYLFNKRYKEAVLKANKYFRIFISFAVLKLLSRANFQPFAFDLFSSIFLMIGFAARFCNIRLTGLLGYWLCMMLFSDVFIWCGINGSIINLARITV